MWAFFETLYELLNEALGTFCDLIEFACWKLQCFIIVFSFLTGLCYSELATRFSLAGSAYVFAYASLGELPAFLLGWSMHLEYSFAGALAVRTLIDYVHAYLELDPMSTSFWVSSFPSWLIFICIFLVRLRSSKVSHKLFICWTN